MFELTQIQVSFPPEMTALISHIDAMMPNGCEVPAEAVARILLSKAIPGLDVPQSNTSTIRSDALARRDLLEAALKANLDLAVTLAGAGHDVTAFDFAAETCSRLLGDLASDGRLTGRRGPSVDIRLREWVSEIHGLWQAITGCSTGITKAPTQEVGAPRVSGAFAHLLRLIVLTHPDGQEFLRVNRNLDAEIELAAAG